VLRNKYRIDVLNVDVTALDVRTEEGREEFLARAEKFLRA
jgi:hypothetical protein